MKKLLIFLCTLFVFSQLFGQHHYLIQGKTPEGFEGKKIYLSIQDNYSNNRFSTLDSTIIRNASFTFSGNMSRPGEWGILKLKEGFINVVIDTGVTTIHVQPVARNSRHYKNSLSNSKISGLSNSLELQLREMRTRHYITYGKSSSMSKGVMELSKEHYHSMLLEELNILRQHPNVYYSLIGLYKLFYELGLSLESKMQAYSTLNEDIKNTLLGKELKQRMASAQSVQIGKEASLFTTRKSSGDTFSNSTLRGKSYLIAFGATWCTPCKKNYPVLQTLYKKYKAKGFEVVAVNLDDNEKKWKEQILHYKLSWINVSELKRFNESSLASLFNVVAVPFYLVVNREGIIVYNSFELKDFDMQYLEKPIEQSVMPSKLTVKSY